MIKFNKPTIGKKDLESVLYCMINDDLTPGNYLKTFSSMLRKSLDLKYVIVFSSYRYSFETIFHLIDASAGDEVIMPSFAKSIILHAVVKLGLKPVLVDLEENSFMPSFDDIQDKVSKKTKCIIIPQIFGIPYDLRRYHKFGLPIVEDLDGSVGSKVDGRLAGSFGTFVTINFNDYAIITTGSGGMLASKDKGLKDMITTIKGRGLWNEHLMSDFNASLGISQLNRLSGNNTIRKRIGEYYDSAVMASGCSFIGRDGNKELSFSYYVVKSEIPFEVSEKFFKGCGIPIRRGIERPLHRLLGLDIHRYKKTEEMFNKLIALPIYPALAKEDIENITKGIRTIL